MCGPSKQIGPREQFGYLGLEATELLGAGGVNGLKQKPSNKIQFDRQPRAALKHESRQETGAREEIVHLIDVAVCEDVLPRYEHLIEHNNRIIFIDPAR